MYLPDRNRAPTTSQFAVRVAVLGGVALAMFSIIFLRLWYLQVLSGDRYLEEAQNNQIREIKVPAPRGEILDRYGKVLVDNRTALALQIQTQDLPVDRDQRKRVLKRVADLAGMSLEDVRKEIREQTKELPASPVTLKRDVAYPLVYYLQEHQTELPGVSVERVFVRHYPQGTLGAHIFGYVSEVTADQLEEPRYQDLSPGDQVGQTGLEYEYDHLLRGRDGATRVQVDALGRPRGAQLSSEEAVPGDSLRTTLDSQIQASGEAALAQFGGLPGAFVAMDVQDGEILGLGSYPTFDPSIFTRPSLSPALYKRLSSEQTGAPLADRAIQGLYPTGSTFKPITAVAALESGLITPDTPVTDTGSITVDTIEFKNAGGQAFGTITLPTALQVSSDVYFYKLGLEADSEKSEPIQTWASNLGIGSATGIDLPAEVDGLVPTPEWRNQLYDQGETDRPWSAGDSVNLAVGQGDLQTNPLQMAVAYAAIANGGDLVRPHLAQRVEDASGRVVQEFNPAPRGHVDIDPEYQGAILSGMHAGAMEPGGTSYPVFGGFPVDIAGKTGTAERGLFEEDQSWYIALAPYPDPKVVVAVTIEQGGFGADAAAPAASQILATYFEHPNAPGHAAPEAPAETGAGAYD
ncbi:MAG TPA: penicillin-binding protein 2 [Solirubrobacterales bacterium]|nr:penicillin-binding protein 2 [Solirubrobacterales bacterium]